MTHVAVIDIGKTNAKLALVDRATLAEIAVVTRPNTVLPGPPWPHFDLEGHWRFLLEGLSAFNAAHGVDAIAITAHGASVVLLDADGALAAPMLDYEHAGPDDLARDYNRQRPDFAETGSPRLAGGLNVGAQLHWMFAQDPGLCVRTAQIVTYPQYWAYRLTGIATTERTSLGCHTDLWNPTADHLSPLAARLGVADKIAPLRMASDILGPITADVAAHTGLPMDTPVTCGIHDSNASLLPHLLTRTQPFSVVSTGTWVVVMTVGGTRPPLSPDRDTLINVNALGDPVPSARFMGGREFEAIAGHSQHPPTRQDVDATLASQTMLTPSMAPETGPFQGWRPMWHPAEPARNSAQRQIAAAYYCALVTATCLGLTDHQGDIVVEGPFARNLHYLSMLGAATSCPVLAARGRTGTSQGAALLTAGPLPSMSTTALHLPEETPQALRAYAAEWLRRCGQG